MRNEQDHDQGLSEAMLAQDRHAAGADGEALAALLVLEQAGERRVRRAALAAWAAVGALIPLVAVAILLVPVVDDGWLRDAVRAAALVLGVFAALAVFVALLATVAWLFRSGRATTIAVVERRLAAIEEMLRKGRPQV